MLSTAEQEKIKVAVQQAELLTSGEIRVFVEQNTRIETMERAIECFHKLEMHKTELRNGVLVYIAFDDRKFAIIGDQGINDKVPSNFWDSTKEAMLAHFKQGNISEGIIKGIEMAGEQLKTFFPRQSNDINELPDDIVIG